MHELNIAMSIVEDVCEIRGREYPGAEILRIRVDVGDLSGVDRESLETVFTAAADGSEIEGAVLELNRVRAHLKCLDCGKNADFEYPHYRCPACGSFFIEIEGGREMTIRSFEIRS